MVILSWHHSPFFPSWFSSSLTVHSMEVSDLEVTMQLSPPTVTSGSVPDRVKPVPVKVRVLPPTTSVEGLEDEKEKQVRRQSR